MIPNGRKAPALGRAQRTGGHFGPVASELSTPHSAAPGAGQAIRWQIPAKSAVRSDRRAFTLIELLVVVAIISILASIALPNFLEAQTRSKVSRAKADMRSMALALEAYHVDNNHYPPRTLTTGGGPSILRVGDINVLQRDLSRITTPIAYISSVPDDVFRLSLPRELRSFDYWDDPIILNVRKTVSPTRPERTVAWTLFSLGPDGVFGSFTNLGNYPPAQTTSYFHDYDPTNGTVSLGNVYRFHNQKEAIDAFLAP